MLRQKTNTTASYMETRWQLKRVENWITRRAWGIYIRSLPSEAIGYLAMFNAVTAMA